jgi:hypothetical protein
LTRQYLIKKIGTPPPPVQLILADQDAYDIIKRMMAKHKSCACDYSKIAGDFYADTTEGIAKKLFDFCKQNIQYKEEKISKQYVSSPQTILSRGYCDCKGYALFCGGVLDALNRMGTNIKWAYRFASDDLANEVPGHVFIVLQDRGGEIWLDPVLNYFNQDHYYPYYQDKKIAAKISGCGCGCADGHAIGSTASTGALIMKVSPELAAVPVVGWIGAAAGTVVGAVLEIFGSKYDISSGVRKLIERYEFLVLGENVHSFNAVNQNDQQPAQNWFSTVLGVPIYDSYRLYALMGVDPNTLAPLNISYDQRAANYFLSAPETVGLVTQAQAVEAAQIADKINVFGSAGSLAYMTAAPSLIETDPAAQPTTFVNQNGQLVDSAGTPITSTTEINPLYILVAAAAAVLLFM